MCHGKAVRAFPDPMDAESFDDGVSGYRFGGDTERRIAILPDIYGCNDFYRGLSTHLAERGAQVFLVDTFAGLGDLPEVTREAAFARRGQVEDKAFLDRFEDFVRRNRIGGVIGFCLGGLYVFELARRGVDADLLGLYGFPQGLPNQDPLPVPFEYLPQVTTPFAMLLGAEDESVGADNIAKLGTLAPDIPAMALKVYDGVGHNFLPFLDSDDADKKAIAKDALARIEAVAA
ncbi:dienelactone hydrolase family protein [Parasphingopyxis algicola]|uniref:dienelactone hydrolase family protein n=1 Tax=Parasphingopyxis algicola TaxID=2026624 RepID=UPI0015A2D60A|nr:dienelactone hydrolase family protein [Parasphingopyxis algicola]QLC26423.1 dienelactone hydrolase family protein [Parasphingopyxis algicola]